MLVSVIVDLEMFLSKLILSFKLYFNLEQRFHFKYPSTKITGVPLPKNEAGCATGLRMATWSYLSMSDTHIGCIFFTMNHSGMAGLCDDSKTVRSRKLLEFYQVRESWCWPLLNLLFQKLGNDEQV